MSFAGKHCVAFDFDLTLADSTEGAVRTINSVLAAAGRPAAPLDAIRRTIGRTLHDTFCALTGIEAPDEISRLVSAFPEHAAKHMSQHTHMMSGARDCIVAIAASGARLGIVSTKYRFRIVEILEREGLASFFDVVIGGEDVTSPKPDPEGLHLLRSKLGVDAAQTLYVGDSVVDAELAERAGVDFIALLTGSTTQEEFENRPVKRFVADLRALAALVPLSTTP